MSFLEGSKFDPEGCLRPTWRGEIHVSEQPLQAHDYAVELDEEREHVLTLNIREAVLLSPSHSRHLTKESLA